jgi:holo-[acyl-carrier protein] synthase
VTLRICVGVDLVDIARIGRMTESGGTAWLRTIWTEEELLYSRGRPDRLASRWAAKEAVFKAFGWRLGEVDPADVEVRAATGEPPELRFSRSALERTAEFTMLSLALSISHEGGLALAQVSALLEER